MITLKSQKNILNRAWIDCILKLYKTININTLHVEEIFLIFMAKLYEQG